MSSRFNGNAGKCMWTRSLAILWNVEKNSSDFDLKWTQSYTQDQ